MKIPVVNTQSEDIERLVKSGKAPAVHSHKDVLAKLRDKAFEASAPAHKRMREAFRLYMNTTEDENKSGWWQSRLAFADKRSIDSKITRGIDDLVPSFLSALAKVDIRPQKTERIDRDIPFIKEIKTVLEQHEEADQESINLETFAYQNLVFGNAISKITFDHQSGVVRSGPISPFDFAPDPDCYDIALEEGCKFVVHTTYHSDYHINRYYPNAKKKSILKTSLRRVDEIMLEPYLASYCGFKVHDETHTVKAVLIDDERYEARSNPYWYPGFNYALWRTYPRLAYDKPTSFWGDSYAKKGEGSQRLADHLLGSILYLLQNLSVGRVVTKKGTLANADQLNVSGGNIELLDSVDDVRRALMFLSSPQIPPELFQAYGIMDQKSDEEMPSLSPVWRGETPTSGASGKLANVLQQANVGQLSAQYMNMNEFNKRRKHVVVNFIQQFSPYVVAFQPDKWRGGFRMPKPLSYSARYLPFDTSVPDVGGMPNTIGGRISVLQFMHYVGWTLRPDRLIDFMKLDTTFSISEDDLIQIAPPGGRGDSSQQNEERLSPLI